MDIGYNVIYIYSVPMVLNLPKPTASYPKIDSNSCMEDSVKPCVGFTEINDMNPVGGPRVTNCTYQTWEIQNWTKNQELNLALTDRSINCLTYPNDLTDLIQFTYQILVNSREFLFPIITDIICELEIAPTEEAYIRMYLYSRIECLSLIEINQV